MALLERLRERFSGKGKEGEEYVEAVQEDLTKLYACEEVDLNTVSRLGESSEEPLEVEPQEEPMPVIEEVLETEAVPMQQQKEEAPVVEEEWQPADGELDFGEGFREWTTSLMLHEPIEVLGLSLHAQESLHNDGIERLGQLLACDDMALINISGIGQGHVDEIRSHLKSYMDGVILHRCEKIQFASVLRSLLWTLPRPSVVLFAERYGFQSLFPLSQAEKAGMAQLKAGQTETMLTKLERELRHRDKQELLDKVLREMVHAFIVPWMGRRLGMASEDEVIERLLLKSDDPDTAEQALRFFDEAFYDSKPCFAEALASPEPGVYCCDEETGKRYSQALGLVVSYFYNPGVEYPLDTLVTLVMRECCRHWEGYPVGFVEKVIRTSPQFHLYKEHTGVVNVLLA